MDLRQLIAKTDKKQLFFLILIFILAFGVRAHLMKYELPFGFDSYYHARMIATLLESGGLPERDPMSYYQLGGGWTPTTGQFFWYFTAFMYKLLTLGAAYNKELWIFFVKLLPALYGAVTCVAVYFLGKEMYDKRVGAVMGFMAAIVPSFVYRTMSGFLEEDSLGFLWLILGFLFFVRAIKPLQFNKTTVRDSVISSVFFIVMALTWEMFMLIPMVLVGYMVIALLNIYPKRTAAELVAFIKIFAINFGIFAVAALLLFPNWMKRVIDYVSVVVPGGETATFAAAIALAVIVVVLAVFMVKKKAAGQASNESETVFKLASLVVLYIIVISLVGILLTVPDFRGEGIFERTVGEENTGKQFFGTKYNMLIVLPYLALLLIPLRIFREKKEHLSAIIFFWIIITLFMAWYKLKFTYTFGLPIAASAGLVTAELFYYFGEKKSWETKILVIPLAFILLGGVAAAAIFVDHHAPSIETNPGWKDALKWISEETPEDAKIFNWWDQGHWISFMGERAVFLDNRNLDLDGDSDFAKFVITMDSGEGLNIIKKYDPDYILLEADMFNKIPSFGIYAFKTTNMQDPRITEYYVGPTTYFACGNSRDASGNVFFSCGPNRIPEEQMNSLNRVWSENPSQVQDERIPLYVYVEKDLTMLYILNAKVNETMLAKLWFNEAEVMQHFEEAYSKDGIKIMKVKK